MSLGKDMSAFYRSPLFLLSISHGRGLNTIRDAIGESMACCEPPYCRYASSSEENEEENKRLSDDG
jgi:hypothetical protein